MKYLPIYLFIAVFIFQSQAQPSQAESDAYSACLLSDCVDELGAVSSQTDAQKLESYKFEKCTTGSKHDADTEDVAADVAQDSKCTTAISFPLLADCYLACSASQYTDGNPNIKSVECQASCLKSSSSSATIISFSMVVIAIVMTIV